jgi:hypothetical protein
MNEHKPTRTTTLHKITNTNTRNKPFESTNSSDYIKNSTKLNKEYYNSSAFFAQTLDAAALHVKAEMAAEQGAPRRRGRRDSVYDGAFEEDSMGGVGSL